MSLTSSIDIDLEFHPDGLITEGDFAAGSLTRDTAFGAGDFVSEAIEETFDISATAPIVAQTGYVLAEGWNILSWPWPYPQDAEEAFASVMDLNDLLIVKNNDADIYWPEYGFNGIGDLLPGQGYQLKIAAGSSIIGQSLEFPLKESEKINFLDRGDLKNALDTTTSTFHNGWNMIGTSRLEPINAAFALAHMSYFGFPLSFNHENKLPGVITTLPRSNQLMSTVSLTNNFEPGDVIQIEYTAGGGDIPQAGLTSTFKENTTIHAFVNEFTASITPIDYGNTINPENVRGSVLTNPLISTLPSISIEWSGSNRVVITGTNTLFTRDFIVATDPSLNYLHTPGSRLFYDAFSKTFSVPILNVISDTQLIAFANNGINYYKHLGNDNQEYVELAGTIDYRPIYSENAEWNENVNPVSVPRFQEQMLIQITGSGTSFLSDFTIGNRVLLELKEFVNEFGVENPNHFRNLQVHGIHSDTSMSIYKGSALTHTLNTNDILGTATPPTAFDFPANLLYHAVASSNGNPLILTYNVTSGEILCYSNNSLFTTQFVPGDVLLLTGNQYINGSQLALITNIDGPSQMQVTPLNELGPYPAVQSHRFFTNSSFVVSAFPGLSQIRDSVSNGAYTQFGAVLPGALLKLTGSGLPNGELIVLVTNVQSTGAVSNRFIEFEGAPGHLEKYNLFTGSSGFPSVNWAFANRNNLVNISIQSRRFTVHAYNKALPVTANAHYNGKLQSSIYYKETDYNNQDISDSVYIIKNNNADIYWPEYGFNGIGDLNPGEGYQIKLNQEFVNVGFPKHAEENKPLIDR